MESFVIAALCGVLVGIFSGLLGIGGGTLMVPLFRLGFGLPAIGATATSLFTIIPTSLSGCVAHIKQKTCIPKLGVVTGIAGACTSALGVFCANCSPAWLIMLAAAAIIAYSSFTMFKKAIRMPKETSAALRKQSLVSQFWTGKNKGSQSTRSLRVACEHGEEGAAEFAEPAAKNHTETMSGALVKESMDVAANKAQISTNQYPHLSVKHFLMAALIGLFAGFASGYVGVGGGFIMVPLFVSVIGITMKHASGTSLIAVTILAIPGVIEQGILGNIDYMAGIAMALGSIPGALLGASLLRFIPERKLRFIFGFFLLISAAVLAGNELLPLTMG